MSDWTAGLHKEVRDLARELLSQGWEFDRTSGKNHPRLLWPATGERISLPGTPSDFRSLPNVRSDAARISGVRAAAHRGPKFRATRGSGFSLDAAKRDAKRPSNRDDLLDRIDRITERICALDPRRDQAELRRLATTRIQLVEDLARYGAEPSPLPRMEDTA